MDSDVHDVDLGILEVFHEFGLFFRIEAEVGVDGEDEPVLSGVSAAGEEVFGGFRVSFVCPVEAGPEVDDAEVGIGIEAFHEFLALVEHVALELVADAIPCEDIVRLDDVLACPALDGVEVDEGFVGNHPGEGEAVEGGGAVVVVSTVEVGVVFDGKDLFEEDEAVEDGGFVSGCDGDDMFDACGEARGEGERQQATDGWTNDGVEFSNTEMI